MRNVAANDDNSRIAGDADDTRNFDDAARPTERLLRASTRSAIVATVSDVLQLPERKSLALAIEVSNPRRGARGVVTRDESSDYAGPGVALGVIAPRDPPARLPEHMIEKWAQIELMPKDVDVALLACEAPVEDELRSTIDDLLHRHHASIADLTRIHISLGPGDLGALQHAVDVAKELAAASGAQLYSVPSFRSAAYSLPWNLAPAIVCLAGREFDAGDGPPVDRAGAHGTLLPPKLTEDDWWKRVGRSALVRLVDGATFAKFEETYVAGRQWLWACDLGWIGPEEVEALRPRTVIAGDDLPRSLAIAAKNVGAALVEPIFTAKSVLASASSAQPTAAAELTPIVPWKALMST